MDDLREGGGEGGGEEKRKEGREKERENEGSHALRIFTYALWVNFIIKAKEKLFVCFTFLFNAKKKWICLRKFCRLML